MNLVQTIRALRQQQKLRIEQIRKLYDCETNVLTLEINKKEEELENIKNELEILKLMRR
ncbi:MAG: hypothetical protein LBF33_02565 [Oscillospiraceae bacterium]|jgi:CRISPR/Cas system CSM-associated protein Csm2 small subunit|nr:hypothetical protein [Oscillospiraceae bacterium]